MYPLPIVLFAAVDTGVWSIEELRAWADALIEKTETSEQWLFDLSLASTQSEAAEIIRQELRRRSLSFPDNVADLLVGLTYLRFIRTEISLRAFVAEIGDILDAYEGSFVDMEGWVDRMNASHRLPDDLKATLENLGRRAERSLARLRVFAVARDGAFWPG